MEVKITLLFINCVTIYLCQLVDAKRSISDIYRMDLEVNGNREDKGPCTSREDCNFLGVCRRDPGSDTKYCDCYQGISGRNCEIIDECADNPGMCGNDPDSICGFHIKKRRAICECKTFGKRFDIPTKTCIDQKPCKTHRECLNGADCINENRDYVKKLPHYCECKFGTSGDYCERVEECIDNPNHCGEGAGVECRYNPYLERAYCQCMDPNQRFDWPLKKCVERKKCRTNEDCLPFGACTDRCSTWEACLDYQHIEEKHSCHCIEGTSGENCEVIDDCHNKIVDCGTSDKVTCDYFYNYGSTAYTYCRCKDRSLQFDHHDKECKECKCGEGSNGCSYKNGEKICVCKPGYKNTNGVCELE